MTRKELPKRVDLEKLTQDDFRLRGEFRVRPEIYHGWKLTPEFRQEGTDAYVPLDQLIPEDKFNTCYELVVQTPDRSEVVGSGYLHRSLRGDVSFGVRSGIIRSGMEEEQKKEYLNSSPVWFPLLNEEHNPIVKSPADFIFVKASPWHSQRDAQRQRVLYD